jgi:hypothetical protein
MMSRNGVSLPAVLAVLLSASLAVAGERRYYQCTLQQVLSGSGDVVLMVEVADDQLGQLGLLLAHRVLDRARSGGAGSHGSIPDVP